ncbi:MAG: T9SS type A sorting domain-containing protein, partial [Bacteroidia bacterium]|nr:T9SS type A sorting domain-containing protein [Bacteroidia bacterium]
AGHYSANIPWGNYNVIQHPPSTLDPFCPASSVPISLSFSNLSDTVNFADTNAAYVAPVPIPLDVETHVGHGTAHPNTTFVYGISVHNLSNSPSGIVTATLNYDMLLSFVSANPAPFSTSPGQVTWQFSSITSFSTTYAHIYVSVPNNPLLIGDTLHASVNVQVANPETNLANNTHSTWHIIIGPFDPNAKTVEQPTAAFIPATDGLFNYTIQFQNTGNDTALNVEVIDTLDSDLDVTTFVQGASSHTYTVDITGQGVIHFYFNNILLPDSNIDEPHSHGFVSFQIHSKANRTHGTVINNTSNIVFDFNPPVATNTTQNTVDLTLAVQATATSICAGQSVTLTMIPELQNTAWRWRTGTCSGVLVGSGNSIMVSPSVTTTYFARDSAGTIPVGSCYRKTIVVNPLPTASITPNGPTTFCAGNSVMLTASGANNYLWSNSASTQSITVSSSGNYFVTVTDGNNCSASTSLSVTVNPLPVASITPNGPTTFCQGDNVMLTASGANNYLWSNSSSSQSITVSSSGNYFVTVTDGNNCSASTSLSVMVNPNPPVPNITQNFDSLVSDAASGYQWYFSSVLIPGANSQSYHPTQNGNYSVVITDVNNCTASSSDYPFVITGMSPPDGADEVLIYPNPATNKIIVQSLKFNVERVEVYDVVGRKVKALTPNPSPHGEGRASIDVSELSPGIYFVKVKGEKEFVVRKFVKN